MYIFLIVNKIVKYNQMIDGNSDMFIVSELYKKGYVIYVTFASPSEVPLF